MLLAALALSGSAYAGGIADGTYDAIVTTSSGTYTVPVEVENGEVSIVHWPNGGDMDVYEGELYGTETTGSNSLGESIDIEIDNPNYEDDE